MGEPDFLTELAGLVAAGGSAKENISRVWGGSGVGAGLRFELQAVERLEDSGPGGQIMKMFRGLSLKEPCSCASLRFTESGGWK